MPRRALLPLAALLAALLGAAACGPARPAPGVVALVNGEPVQQAELDRLAAQQSDGAPLSPEQDLRLRLALLGQLIDRHILLQYAQRSGLAVDPAELARQLEAERRRSPGLADALLRRQVSDDLLLQALMRREVADRVQIDSAQIAAFYQKNHASFNLPERQYHVLEIVVTPQAAPVANLAEDKAATPAAAKKKILALQAQLARHADFGALAQQFSEDPSTAASGGDLGLIPQSVLMTQTPAALRDAILALRPGQISNVIATPAGLYLVKLVEIEPAGLRPLADPQVRQSIQDLLANARQQVLQTAFLTTLRDQAKVVNYLAQQVLANPFPPAS